MEVALIYFFIYFNCYLTVPQPTLGHSQGDSFTNPMLITVFVHIRPEGSREPRNKVGSLSPAEHLAGFEPRTFQFLLQCLKPLGHSPLKVLILACYMTNISNMFLAECWRLKTSSRLFSHFIKMTK